MARARNIKPGFFTNDVLAECEPLARLMFAGMWCISDREGRIEDRPKKIKAETLPYDNCDPESLLQQLAKHGFILRYESGGVKYIQILNFAKHQNPHVKESASTIPAPDLSGAVTGQEQEKEVTGPADSLNPITDSLNLIPDSRELRARAKRASAKTPLPENFHVSGRVEEWASAKGYTRLGEHLESFIGKCRAKDYRYVDWDEAFMTAIRDDWAKLRQTGDGKQFLTPAQRRMEATDKAIAQWLHEEGETVIDGEACHVG